MGWEDEMLRKYFWNACVGLAMTLGGAGVAQAETLSVSDEIIGPSNERNFYSSVAFTPETDPVRITGTVDFTNFKVGSVLMIGLLDSDHQFSSITGYPDGKGAWAYFTLQSPAAGERFRIGPSNGNVNGEVISVFTNVPKSNGVVIPFELIIGKGQITFTSGAFTRTISYDANDFSGNAHVAVDMWSPGSVTDSTATYSLNAAPLPLPAAVWAGLALMGGIGVSRRFRSRELAA
jgi:hypothetical protein